MTGTTFELGTRGTADVGANGGVTWDVTAYYSQISDEILAVENPLQPQLLLAMQVHAGIEAWLGYRSRAPYRQQFDGIIFALMMMIFTITTASGRTRYRSAI